MKNTYHIIVLGSSRIGKTISELTVDGRTGHDLMPFPLDRILSEENPIKNFTV